MTVLCLCLGGVMACGGGGSDSSAPNNDEPNNSPAQVDMSGVWQVEETVTGSCDGEEYPFTKLSVYTCSQQGNSVSMQDNLEGTTITGTVNGYTLSFTTTLPDGAGELTVDFAGTCASDGLSFTGTSQWTYIEPGYTCSGTSQTKGTKTSEDQVDASGSWSGTFHSEEYGISGGFSVEIIDTDGILTGTISVPYIDMVNAQLQGEVDGSAITFGDIEGRITFSGILSNSNAAEGSYVYNDMDDEGAWTANRLDE